MTYPEGIKDGILAILMISIILLGFYMVTFHENYLL